MRRAGGYGIGLVARCNWSAMNLLRQVVLSTLVLLCAAPSRAGGLDHARSLVTEARPALSLSMGARRRVLHADPEARREAAWLFLLGAGLVMAAFVPAWWATRERASAAGSVEEAGSGALGRA